MITFKPVFGPRKRKDGTYAVRIRITNNRKIGYFPTPYGVTPESLNKKGELLVNDTNKDLSTDLTMRINDYMLRMPTLGVQLDTISISDLVAALTAPIVVAEVNMLRYFEDKINLFHHTKALQTVKGYHTALDRFKTFLKKDELSTSELTVKLLNDFEIHLRSVKPTFNEVEKKKTVSNTTIRLYMTYLSTLCKIAEEENVLVSNPFRKGYHIVKANNPDKRNLDIETLRKLVKYVPVTPLEKTAHDVMMISYLMCGMNTADIFYCPLSKQGRITYQRLKTKNRREDKAETSVLIQPELKPYLKKHLDKDRLFDFHRQFKQHLHFVERVNDGLEDMCDKLKIAKITTYNFRHTWATIARNDLQIPKDDIHFALNHTTAINITDTYLATDWSIIDRCNRKVVDYLFEKRSKEANRKIK